MRALSDLIRSHRIPGIRLSEMRATCAAAASGLVGHPIQAKEVTLKEGVLTFKVPSVIKSELMLRSTTLIEILGRAGISIKGIR